MKSRRAFTLIELLVVIAIIAILAAILFPVFAQAKMAAKAAASMSNCHQTTTASEIYNGDFDDLPVLNSQNDRDAPLLLGGSFYYKPWGWLQQPYMKNTEILQDPMATKERSTVVGVSDDIFWAYRTQYGYAFTIHSPVIYEQVGSQVLMNPHPVSPTGLAAPADTVKFITKKIRGTGATNQGDWYWVADGSVVWGGNLVNPPALYSDQFYTDPNVNPKSVIVPKQCWGAVLTWGCSAYSGQNENDGSATGGVALRRNDKAIVCMADTHARPMSAGALAAGTNFTRNATPFSVRMTDKTKYLWDQD